MKRTMFTILLTAALAVSLSLVVTPASAQYFGRNKVQYDDFDFRHFSTDHFQIYLYPEEETAVRDVARMAERWYTRHAATFDRTFEERKPLIFYANDADFQQTNVIGGLIGQGTGGVTESLKERVVMPLTGIYSETNHVLGHELVHSFQYDIALNRRGPSRFALGQLPLWLVEGMAEYLSVGREDPHTAMWLRDAILRDDLPTMEQLSRGTRYFPYRYGQAYMAYIGGKYGDAAVANLYKQAGEIGLDTTFIALFGITSDSLSREWQQAVRETYEPLMEGRTPPDAVGRRVLSADLDAGEMNIAPAVSPDGRWVAFLSERDLFNINLFIADAETGEVVRELKQTNSDPHFDALRFINSAGSWSPDGTRFAFITFVKGDNEIAIWNLSSGEIERRTRVQGVTAMMNPAWSPNGTRLAFSGMDGGLSDLYLLNLESGQVRQLTNDRYADLQPAWSPDGTTLAFTTDRGPDGSDFETLSFAAPRLGLIDVETGQTQVLQPFGSALHHNPQFAPDGRSLYFISDYDGFKDIYRYELASETTYRVTQIQTGVSGITSLAPALSVAAQSGRLMFSVFSDSKYLVHTLTADEAQGEPVTPAPGPAVAGVLPPVEAAGQGLVSAYLNDSLTGLPPAVEEAPRDYSARLALDYVAPPAVGVSTGGAFGTQLSGGIAFFFSDMLGNQNLALAVQAQGTFKDIGGQVSYLNQGSRFNYGASVGHIPYLFGRASAGIDPTTGARVIEQVYQRIYIDQAYAIGAYPFSMTRRFEVNAGFVRYGYDFEVVQTRFFPDGTIDRNTEDLSELEPDPAYFFQGAAAYVGDFSNFGFTSPVQGGRYRFQVAPRVGTDSYVTVLADWRRYLFFNPVTFAVRGLHIGNYGASADEMFAQEYLGSSYYPGFVRGYNFRSFDADECTEDSGTCPEVDRLQGTRIAIASAEVRLPLLGTERFGLLNFPYLPTELAFFTDVGLAWTQNEPPVLELRRDTSERVPVISSGVSARINLLGYIVLEPYFVYPYQRPARGWHFGLQLAPGW